MDGKAFLQYLLQINSIKKAEFLKLPLYKILVQKEYFTEDHLKQHIFDFKQDENFHRATLPI